MKHFCRRSWDRLLMDPRLFLAGKSAALRDSFLIRARVHPEREARTKFVREARRYHHDFMKQMRAA